MGGVRLNQFLNTQSFNVSLTRSVFINKNSDLVLCFGTRFVTFVGTVRIL